MLKWCNSTKGYRFIEQEGGGSDVFVHISEVEKAGLSLNDNQSVGYEVDDALVETISTTRGFMNFEDTINDITNNKCETLDLSKHNIDDVKAEKIADALKQNKSVTGLSLIDNNIGDKGAEKIAEALKDNESVAWINLAKNDIGDEGAKKIAEALKDNASIIEIKISYNNKIGIELSDSIINLVNLNKLFQKAIQSGSFGEQNIFYIQNNKYLTFIKNHELYDIIFKANQLPAIEFYFQNDPEFFIVLLDKSDNLVSWLKGNDKHLTTFLTGLTGSECISNATIAIVSKIHNIFTNEEMTNANLGLLLDITKKHEKVSLGTDMIKTINYDICKYFAHKIQSTDQSTDFSTPESKNMETQTECMGINDQSNDM